MALGSRPEEFVSDLKLVLNKYGNILVNDKCKTSNPKIYAGGDLAGKIGTVAWAAKSGRDAAISICEDLKNKITPNYNIGGIFYLLSCIFVSFL